MSAVLTVRTHDAALYRALNAWWHDFSPMLPEKETTVTDLDSFAAAGLPGEITLSYTDPAASLMRPFSYEALEGLVLAFEKPSPALVFKDGTVFFRGAEIDLSPLEKRLLLLLWQADRPLSQKELSRALFNKVRSSNQINVYIRYLRKKLLLPGGAPFILTKRNEGFYIDHDKRTL